MFDKTALRQYFVQNKRYILEPYITKYECYFTVSGLGIKFSQEKYLGC